MAAARGNPMINMRILFMISLPFLQSVQSVKNATEKPLKCFLDPCTRSFAGMFRVMIQSDRVDDLDSVYPCSVSQTCRNVVSGQPIWVLGSNLDFSAATPLDLANKLLSFVSAG